MATVQCTKCTVERKGFRRELDSWRCKLIHCIGFESILEGIYGPMLLRDLSVFDDCEPEEVDDWSPQTSCSQCSFCNLPLDRLIDHAPAAASPLSSPSDYSPCQPPSISESSQSAHRFLQAVFKKKDVALGFDSNIPLIAQELMIKMVHQFAKDYASKCILPTSTNGVKTRTSSPLSETADTPLDLTVSRTQEENDSEPELDGVLDLSNRNSACSATPLLSSNNNASGSLLPSLTEDLGQRGTGGRQSLLDAVLGALCPAHRSLLRQILKQAHGEKLTSLLHQKAAGQTESFCCHLGGHPMDVIPHAVTLGECEAHKSSPYCPLMDCDHEGHSSTMYHSGDSKSKCSIHHYPVKGCISDGSMASNYCRIPRCRMETHTVLCPKRLHCISCQRLAVGHVNQTMCSSTSSPIISKPPSLCTPSPSICPSSSICCSQHTPPCCPCYSNHACPMQVGSTIERGIVDGDPPCPVLKRERSPSPPPLSPIPSDIHKKTDEKPPSLHHHRQEEQTGMSYKNGSVDASHHKVDVTKTKEEELLCGTPASSQAEQNPSGTLLQDVVNRFSEKLETIKPLEKEPLPVSTAVSVSEKELMLSPSTSQNLQYQTDVHLTEIITKVLHEGNGSDYNLSELLNRHDSKEPKSPNTRSRRRQEVLAAIATPADDSSARRHTLQIKREFAMLDQSCNRRKVPLAKKSKFNDGKDSSPVKEESKIELEGGDEFEEKVGERSLGLLPADSYRNEVKDEIQAVIVKEDYLILKSEENEWEIQCEEKDPAPELQNKYGKQGSKENGEQELAQRMTVTATSVEQCARTRQELEEMPSGESSETENRPIKGQDCRSSLGEKRKCQSNHSEEGRRSRRIIVPPQWFSSYVTEPRKMFFVACFSESIFNQRTQKEQDLTSTTLDVPSEVPDAEDAQLESRNDPPLSSTEQTEKLSYELRQKGKHGPHHAESEAMAAEEKSQHLDVMSDNGDIPVEPFRRLRSAPKRLQLSMTASKLTSNASNGNSNVPTPCAEKPPNLQEEYTSPIKLMFVSAVKDEGGIRYSLKSAGSSSNSPPEEPFDPCEVSSWSGTPEKKKSQTSPTSKVNPVSAPLKSTTSPAKPASSSAKSANSSPKSASPLRRSVSSPSKAASSSPKFASPPQKSPSTPRRSASSSPKSASSPKSSSSSPKVGSRRSGESTPTKRGVVSESRRSPSDFTFHESPPPKRRPGRPKKLGPQLEQKAKRPIGRPRKQKTEDPVIGPKALGEKSLLASDAEENVNKNLKITVLYGRSRRNKRTVSEGFDQLQTEFHDAWRAVGLRSDLGILMHSSKASSGSIETTSMGLPEDFKFVQPVKESAPLSSSNIKCQKRDDSTPSRKPGRPAKVKISGISVTVTTVSPRQRKIQINRETRQSPEALIRKPASQPEFKSAKEPRTIGYQSTNRGGDTEKREGMETKNEGNGAVRHSMRVKKPSIHFLHAVAISSSRSYSHSNALLRRSKQLLLNKASNERRKEEQQHGAEPSGGKRQPFGQDKRKNVPQDLSRVAGVSQDSIFSPEETLRWWAASAEEKTMNQELARRIRLISDSWVSDTVENKEKEIALKSKMGAKGKSPFPKKSKQSSVVRALFDCPPDEPSSCSTQQLCSWFMQTTETQSLAIVKKATSRHHFEPMHFPRSASNKSVCSSPQAERLRKHIKKFAKTVPKSPLQHQLAQRLLKKRSEAPLHTRFRRQLFPSRFAAGKLNREQQLWRSNAFRNYRAAAFRARKRFLTRKEREGWQRNNSRKKVAASCSNGPATSGPKQRCTASCRSAEDPFCDGLENCAVDQTEAAVDVRKEQNLCSKAWSPETLKECRVFLRKINSPDNESPEEEWDSCTVTLDDGSPSAYVFAARERELMGVVKAVKTGRVRMRRRRRRTGTGTGTGTASGEPAGSAPAPAQDRDETPARRQNGRCGSPEVVSTEPPQPPPAAKTLRQSRMRGLTGPRWCDFVFEN